MLELDWSKPIQFEDGEPCELREILDPSTAQFGRLKIYLVFRPEAENIFTSLWWMEKDGKSGFPGKSIINKPEIVETTEVMNTNNISSFITLTYPE